METTVLRLMFPNIPPSKVLLVVASNTMSEWWFNKIYSKMKLFRNTEDNNDSDF